MKKKILAFILALASVFMLLTSCEIIDILDGPEVSDEGAVTVVVENYDGSYDVYEASLSEVENKAEGAEGIIEHLNQKKGLYLEMVDSIYGAYVSAVGSIKENSTEATYVIVYTSISTDSYQGAPTVDYNGTTLYQAGVGLSRMSVDAGTVIMFRAEKSPY